MADDPGKRGGRREGERRRGFFDALFRFALRSAAAALFASRSVDRRSLCSLFQAVDGASTGEKPETETEKITLSLSLSFCETSVNTNNVNRLVRSSQGPAQKRPPGTRVALREEACFFSGEIDADASRSKRRCCCCCCCSFSRRQGEQRWWRERHRTGYSDAQAQLFSRCCCRCSRACCWCRACCRACCCCRCASRAKGRRCRRCGKARRGL